MCWCHAHAMATMATCSSKKKSGNLRSLSRRRYQQRLSFLRFVATTTSYPIPEQAVPETKQQGNVVIIESPKPEKPLKDPNITETEETAQPFQVIFYKYVAILIPTVPMLVVQKLF